MKLNVIQGYEAGRQALSRQDTREVAADEREQAVRDIINDVGRRGDQAIIDCTARFDGVSLKELEVSRDRIDAAREHVAPDVTAALELAAGRIRDFHAVQKRSFVSGAGPSLRWLVRPLARVGVYAPGGTANLPSSLLMTAIPAKVAGVGEIVLATPPGRDGAPPPTMLLAAGLAGVDRIFAMGGAQAVAALAFGTESVPRVDKVCGPGSIYVILAKKLLYGTVGIDALQGPSEVLIVADEAANPAYCAADLLAQAEHDVLASAVLVTTSAGFAERVNTELASQLPALSRKEIAAESLRRSGRIIVVESLDEAVDLANLYAPEHLLLMVRDPEALVDRVTNAGCIVLGDKATVAIGDYVAGPSHVLPTEGTARFSSPQSILDFVKLTNVISVDGATLEELGPAADTIAAVEGLDAHGRAVRLRRQADG
jgi:histidinol dehydrogenase